ncbi:hypothetical protein [Marinococcus sp. PL1-022]|jgi:hypothetical protein|uniref:hypothetical protein n=1 Tax=Marinococcus sp. PL1-022 TaxID=3095363 RepID=UPI00261139F4|nr:hypothetical protein [Marinococcus sp. PL1-022]MDX6153272.1 hypothetical protein [Marinococcus sp. PL1-022]
MTPVEKPSALNRARKKKAAAIKAEGEFARQLKSILVFQEIDKQSADKMDNSFRPKKTIYALTGERLKMKDIAFVIKLKGFTGLYRLFSAYHADCHTNERGEPVVVFQRRS